MTKARQQSTKTRLHSFEPTLSLCLEVDSVNEIVFVAIAIAVVPNHFEVTIVMKISC